MIVRNWKAARSGAHITVRGVDNDTGLKAKITGVESIAPSTERTNAVVYAHTATATHALLL